MWAPLAAVALLTRAAAAAPPWQNQEGISMCNWAQFRGRNYAVVRFAMSKAELPSQQMSSVILYTSTADHYGGKRKGFAISRFPKKADAERKDTRHYSDGSNDPRADGEPFVRMPSA